MKKLPMKILAAIALTLALAAHAAILPLHDAARRNDAAAIAELLDAGINPNMKDSQQYTALYIATELGHIEAIVALLKGGADPKAVSGRWFYSPLHAAAGGGHVEAILTLLDAGADPNESRRDYFPLHAAAGGGHVEAILTLLAAGADPNANRGRETPLYAAIRAGGRTGSYEAMDALLNPSIWPWVARADPNFENAFGITPLEYAARLGDEAAILILLEAGADPI